MILLLSYDLDLTTGRHPFFEAVKQQGQWWHYLTSTWLLSTFKTPQQVLEALRPYMLPTDRVLIIEVGQNYNGYLPKEAWDWIQRQQSTDSLRKLGAFGSIQPSISPPPGYIPDLAKAQTKD